MDSEFWKQVESIANHYGKDRLDQREALSFQLHQLGSEMGEANSAFIGVTGANDRKGFSHTMDDLANEFGDIALTAMISLFFCADDPELVMQDTIRKISSRIERRK